MKWKNRKEIAFFFEKIEIAFLTILTPSKKEFRKKKQRETVDPADRNIPHRKSPGQTLLEVWNQPTKNM